jgi:hypothetical protein
MPGDTCADAVTVEVAAERLSRPGALAQLSGGFSVDVFGTTQAMHDYHTGSPQSFRLLVGALRRARAARIPFVLVFRLTRSNYRHAGEMVRVAHTLGARALGLGSSEGRSSVPAPPAALLAAHVTRAFDVARSLGLPIADGERAEPESARRWLPPL